MQLKIRTYLEDILTSIDAIHDYLGDKRDFRVYQQTRQLRSAVERELTIIGEATNRILKLDSNYPLETPAKSSICEIGSAMDMMPSTMHPSGRSSSITCPGCAKRSINS